MSELRTRVNPLFHLAAFSTALFIITIFALVAVMFGDQTAPPVRFLNRYGGALVLGEVAGIFVFGLLAMTVDRIQILRSKRRQHSAIPRSERSDG